MAQRERDEILGYDEFEEVDSRIALERIYFDVAL
jgi:hypothetical protein